MFKRITPTDFPRDKFVETAIRLFRLEDELGKPFEEDLKDMENALTDVSAKKDKVTAQLVATKKSKTQIDTELKDSTTQLTANRKLLKESINRRKSLEELDLDELCKLANFGVECKELGYSGANLKKVAKLAKNKPKLEKRTATLKKRIKNLKEKIELEEVKREAIITVNGVLYNIRNLLESQTIGVACKHCNNQVAVHIPRISALKAPLETLALLEAIARKGRKLVNKFGGQSGQKRARLFEQTRCILAPLVFFCKNIVKLKVKNF